VFPAVLLAIAVQWILVPLSTGLHLAIAAVLSWNTLLPALNPFEVAYNRWIAGPRGQPPLVPAPGPRRFAQGMAAAFNLGAAVALLAGQTVVAWLLQTMLVVAFSALLFGKLCLGAYVFHLLKGRVAFANSTLPWARG
jgi:hypothetical protein